MIDLEAWEWTLGGLGGTEPAPITVAGLYAFIAELRCLRELCDAVLARVEADEDYEVLSKEYADEPQGLLHLGEQMQRVGARETAAIAACKEAKATREVKP